MGNHSGSVPLKKWNGDIIASYTLPRTGRNIMGSHAKFLANETSQLIEKDRWKIMDINFDKLKTELQNCKTDKQVIKLLNKLDFAWYYSDYEWYKESGEFSIYLTKSDNGKFYRIYKNTIRKEYMFQVMEKCKMEYSGIPVFFG